MQDLRHRVLRFEELRRRHAAHQPLTAAEREELDQGIPADEYLTIIEQIRHERRSASPSKAARKDKATRKEKAVVSADLGDFLTTPNKPFGEGTKETPEKPSVELVWEQKYNDP